ncbi:hypothetical protein VITFI_CDS2943 [Vitreoscilla filiformis]|uniref:Uncharacterized protein n=1 Tax=Vitreoscilla filiformis TaxID=63 RepID=A0A221KIU5_VITFI|nr:hypothetical protein VITFI_CDS2943 [Vitreoscilla filiformis]
MVERAFSGSGFRVILHVKLLWLRNTVPSELLEAWECGWSDFSGAAYFCGSVGGQLNSWCP